jgi:hypothetical protein
MAFTYTILGRTVFGNKRIVYGTYASSSSSTGGDILTGLRVLEAITITQKGSAVTTGAPVVNETLPLAGGAATIVTDADGTGSFIAIGY